MGRNFLKKVSKFAKQISSEPLFKNFYTIRIDMERLWL